MAALTKKGTGQFWFQKEPWQVCVGTDFRPKTRDALQRRKEAFSSWYLKITDDPSPLPERTSFHTLDFSFLPVSSTKVCTAALLIYNSSANLYFTPVKYDTAKKSVFKKFLLHLISEKLALSCDTLQCFTF